MEKDKLLDIDYLKNNNQRLYYFGLGFIQLVLNKYERIHFYNIALPVLNDEIHNHRYNFRSTILKGTLQHKKFRIINGDDYMLCNELCTKDIINKTSKLDIQIPVNVELIDMFTIYNTPGAKSMYDYYDMFFNEFHTVRAVGNTITHIKRTDVITPTAQVLYNKNKNSICPFSKTYTDDELWGFISDTINN